MSDIENNTNPAAVPQAESPESKGSASEASAGAARLNTLDFGKFAPLPWRAHDTQDSRGWIIKDALDRTVAIMGNYVPTRAAAETIVAVMNAWADSEVRRLESEIKARSLAQ